jgi:hypothetical protein
MLRQGISALLLISSITVTSRAKQKFQPTFTALFLLGMLTLDISKLLLIFAEKPRIAYLFAGWESNQ